MRVSSDAIKRGWTKASSFLLLLVVGVLMWELFSGGVLFLWPLIRSETEINPMKYTDAMIERLYGGDVLKYRKSIEESWQRLLRYEPLVELAETPYRGTYVNVSPAGYRHVPEQEPLESPSSRRRIFVFGGSTTFGLGVPDDETIPAYLQQALRARGMNDVALFNFGVGSYYSTQERIAFLRLLTDGRRPEIAIFIDGINEFNDVRFPDRSATSDRIAFLVEHPFLGFISQTLTMQLLAKTARRLQGDLSDQQTFNEQSLRKVVDRLAVNRAAIRGACANLAIRCLFVQQPVPFYGFDNSKRAVPLSAAHRSLMGNLPERIGPGYRMMREDQRYAIDDVLWLADLQTSKNMYIDAFHYSPAMNAAIGEAIGSRLFGSK